MGLTTDTTTPAQIAAQRIRDIDATILANLQAGLVESYNTFWHNAQGAAPQQIAAILGADLAFGMQQHYALGQVVIAVCEHDGLTPGVPNAIPNGWTYTVNADGTLNISSPPAVSFGVSPQAGPVQIKAGQAATVQVVAMDVNGNTVLGYTGTANIACTDSAAVLPASVTFVGGQASFAVTFSAAGAPTLTLTDTSNPSLTGSAQASVNAAS